MYSLSPSYCSRSHFIIDDENPLLLDTVTHNCLFHHYFNLTLGPTILTMPVLRHSARIYGELSWLSLPQSCTNDTVISSGKLIYPLPFGSGKNMERKEEKGKGHSSSAKHQSLSPESTVSCRHHWTSLTTNLQLALNEVVEMDDSLGKVNDLFKKKSF